MLVFLFESANIHKLFDILHKTFILWIKKYFALLLPLPKTIGSNIHFHFLNAIQPIANAVSAAVIHIAVWSFSGGVLLRMVCTMVSVWCRCRVSVFSL